jgi:hypothetical protein
VVDYPVTDPDFASLTISPGSSFPMSQAGWQNAGPSNAFFINGKELANDVSGKDWCSMDWNFEPPKSYITKSS